MKNLVYLSTSRTILPENILLDILASARKNNKEYNVTSVLLYSGGTFIQALEGEGEDEDVDHIFAKIEKDIRHKNIVVMMERDAGQRVFPTWSMGFASVDKTISIEFIDSFIATGKVLNCKSKDTSIAMLKAFIETNKLVIGY